MKKIFPVCGFLPATVLAVFTTVSLGRYSAPVLTLELTPDAETITAVTDSDGDNSEILKEHTVTTAVSVPTVAAVSETAAYKDGTYIGTGTGFSGPIKVQVVIADGKITNISIVSTTDDSPFIDSASSLLKNIISKQSTNVDTVSGATYSSVGLIEAVRDALQQAGGDSSSYSALPALSPSNRVSIAGTPTVQSISEPSAYRDGTYTGTGTGFAGTITVQVTVLNGKISEISLLSSKDDSPYIDSASALLHTIVSKQSTNVDTVSGATYSSVGLIEAVRNALSGAAVTTTVTLSPLDPDSTAAVTGTFPYQDGVYLGTGQGYRSDITVAVSLKNGTIDTILILDENEDESFFQKAETIADTVIKKQTTDVDVVSGATFSSEGILTAINNALESAASVISTTASSSQTTESTTTVTTTSLTIPVQNKYADGEYTAIAICYPDASEDFDSYTLSVTIRIENDAIVEIKNIQGSGSYYDAENDWYISRAVNGTSKYKGVAAQILEQQETGGIDAVSGATCTSDAIIEAVSKALSAAMV